MGTLFFNSEVHLGLDVFKIIMDDHLMNDGYSNYNNLKDDQELFLEPFLIAHYNVQNLDVYPLDQILYNYLNQQNIEVVSDHRGIIYLPETGYLITKFPNTMFSLQVHDNTYTLIDKNSKKEVDFLFEELLFVRDSSIEIVKYNHPYIYNKLANDKRLKELSVKDVNTVQLESYSTVLNKGYELIKEVDELQYLEIQKLVKKIVFFDCGYFMNFTSMDIQGVVFISSYNAAKPLTFIDTLIHETSHLALNLILMNHQEYFTIDPFELRFNSPFFKKSIKRGLYHSIHATYVLSKLVRFYNKLYDSEKLQGVQKYELLSLFLLDIKLLGDALSFIDDQRLYTEKGKALFNEMKLVYETISLDKKTLIDTYKIPEGYDNQNAAVTPRFFEADDFLQANNLTVETLDVAN